MLGRRVGEGDGRDDREEEKQRKRTTNCGAGRRVGMKGMKKRRTERNEKRREGARKCVIK